jgi:hypothetical protein
MLVLAAAILSAAPALADNFSVGDPITYSLATPYVSAPGYGYGGLFTLTDTKGGASIQTFCIELTEYVYPTGNYVGSISNVAVQGGRSGGPNDAISPGTDWLYAQFITGNPAYSNTRALQMAFWILEGETLNNDADTWWGTDPDYATAKKYVEDASEITSGTYGTKVLNLVDAAGNNRQSELIYVPEPGILILLGIALSAVGLAARRFRL